MSEILGVVVYCLLGLEFPEKLVEEEAEVTNLGDNNTEVEIRADLSSAPGKNLEHPENKM